MEPVFFLVILIVILVILFILIENNDKNPLRRREQALKHGMGTEGCISNQQTSVNLLVALVEILKATYYRYVKGLPNYEMAQRLMTSLGYNLCGRLPFGSTKYQLTADPVHAKRIMSDPSWSERFPLDYYLQDPGFHKPYGLITGGGKYWKPANRITRTLLQQLGFYSPVTMEGRFRFEMEELERQFDVNLALNAGEHTFCPRDIFGYLGINVVLLILLGKRNAFDEQVVTKLLKTITTVNKKITPVTTFLEIIPFLRHFSKLTFMRHFNEISTMIYAIFRDVIVEKRRTGKYKERVGDLLDGLLQHVDKSKGSEDGLSEENMLVVLRDMLMAGGDTISATLEHALLYMSLHPEVQEKVQAEIDCVLGLDRAPTYEDRYRMPYTRATLYEVFRIGSSIPATARAKYKGKECSYALISIYGAHRNPIFYAEPNEFKPERFLDTQDPTQVVNTDYLMPFGYGRRSCPAETAAGVAVFVYFVVMLQKYWIKLSTHHPTPSMKNTHGFSRSPLRYFITIRKRR